MNLEFVSIEKSPKFDKLIGLANSLPKPDSSWDSVFAITPSVSSSAKLYLKLLRKKNWKDIEHPRCMIVFHGQGEHSGRYDHLAHYLNDDIDMFFMIDHQGHGQSTGIRGHVKNFDNYADDVADVVKLVKKWLIENNFKHSSLHIFSHSMGGMICLRMLIKYPELKFNSVIVSNPMIELAITIPKWQQMISKALRSVVGWLPVKTESLAKLTSRDPVVVQNYIDDPLGHGMATPDFYWTFLDSKKDTLQNFTKVKQPILLLLGGDDKIIVHEVTQEMFEESKTEGNKLIVYEEGYHELINDLDKELVFKDISKWVTTHQK